MSDDLDPEAPDGSDDDGAGNQVSPRSAADYRPLDFTDPGPGWASSVWWLFAPVVLLLCFALWQRSGPSLEPQRRGEPHAPDSLSANAIVDGWSAHVQGPEIALRLEPLHPVPARQAFDAAALAARYRGGEDPSASGAQPWRLTLAAGESPADPARAIVDLSGVVVLGLEPLIRPAGPRTADPEGALVEDPLATLLRFPVGPLRAGETCDLVFWGPPPGGEVTVTAPGLGAAAVLRQLARSTRPSSGAIARLDARDGARSEPR